MTIWDIMNEIDEQSNTLSNAQAVLDEATGYFAMSVQPGSDEAAVLIQYVPHIARLLHVVARLLNDIEPELNNASHELLCIHRNLPEQTEVA